MRPDGLLESALRLLGPGTSLHGSLRNSGWYVGPDIPSKKLAGAREGFAPYDPAQESAVLLYDGTIFGSAKRGLLLTTGALYWSITSADDGFSEVRSHLALGAIKHLALDAERVCLNGEPIGAIIKPDLKEARVLGAFFAEVVGADAWSDAGLAPALSPVAKVQAAPARQSADEVFQAIRGLKALRDEGALSEAEYTAKKQELLQRL